jgi:Zn-dependent protease
VSFDLPSFLTWYIALILSLVLHEAAHAWVAMLGGDRTAYESGQVTLNPVPHIRREPFGTVLLPILSHMYMGWVLGFAHAPYNPYWAEAHPRRAAVMSAAGPLANLLLAALLFLVMKIGLGMDWFERPLSSATRTVEFMETIVVAAEQADEGVLAKVALMCSVLFSLNLILGLFNLIPLPPLDGAGIAEGILPGPLGGLYRFLRMNPTFAILGLLAAWYLARYIISTPFYWAVRLLYG